MKTIKLAKAWTYRTPEVTIDYLAGEHQVRDEIAAQAPKEKRNGGRTAKARPTRAAVASEG